MITSTELIRNALVSPVREIDARVELFEGSTLIDTCNCHDKLIKFDIQRIGDTSKFFGFGICQRLNFHLIDKDRQMTITTAVTAKVSFTVDGENFVYPYPDFYVTEVNRDENTNELSVTAYDALYRASAIPVGTVDMTDVTSLKPYVDRLAEAIGVQPSVSLRGFPEDDTSMTRAFALPPNLEGIESIREVLDDAAEASMSIYYLDSNNTLWFRRLNEDDEPDYYITKEDYFTLSSKTNRRLSAICRATELGDNVTASIEAAGTTQYVRDNAFWDNRDDIDEILNEAILFMGGFTLNQFACSWRGNFLLEIGDKIALTTKDNDIALSYVIDDTVEYSGVFAEKTNWEYTAEDTETDSNPSTIGELLKKTYAKVDKVNQRIEIVAGETAAIKMTNDSIANSVQELNEAMDEVVAEVNSKMTSEELAIHINRVMADGVDKVTTTTGYTFNEEGLHINKSGSDITTTITEDGMNIYRKDNEVLVADNSGVKAEDLHATTYLIVGTNSRFENYKNDRTGCFYIGKVEVN